MSFTTLLDAVAKERMQIFVRGRNHGYINAGNVHQLRLPFPVVVRVKLHLQGGSYVREVTPGTTFLVDHFMSSVNGKGYFAYVRDYRAPPLGQESTTDGYRVWSLPFRAYDIISDIPATYDVLASGPTTKGGSTIGKQTE